jgi:hypothetical protein
VISPDDAVNRGDIRMVQRGKGPGLAIEPGQTIRVRRDRLRQHLDRDVSRQVRIDSAVDFAHSTGTDLRGDVVGTKSSARRECH